jgi:bacterioferritin (cytochrome b1)
MAGQEVTRDQLAELLNEDLSREYQAIIAYVVYSQVLKGAEYMSIAAQLERARAPRAAARAHHLAADRLSRQDADRHGQAGENLGQGPRHAEIRPG